MAEFDLGSCVGGAFGGDTISVSGAGSTPWTSGPAAIVTEHVNLAHSYASTAFDNTWCFLTGLANFAPELNNISSGVNFDDITTPTPTINVPASLVSPTINITLPTFPEFVQGDIYEYDENAIGPVPVLTANDPTINLPARPGELDAVAPETAPTLSTYEFPDPVSYSLPNVPNFEDLNIPTAPVLTIPDFELALPTPPVDLVAPGLIFSFSEEGYSSTLMASLTAELLDRIQNGGTGISPTIEQAIWDRARNREDQNSIRSENQINIEQAAKGFYRPSGAHLAALDQLAQETQNKNADLSREIAIKQADMEQQNIQFALQTSLALEQAWLQYHNQVQQRAFEVEKYTQQVAIDLYQAAIQRYNVELEIYKTYAQAFESRVRAELAEAEIYKTQLEGQKLIGDLNVQKIQLYEAQLKGITTAVEVYRSELDAVKIRVEADGLQIQNFKALVDVFSARVAAKASEYEMYASAVKGEMAKADIFDSQVKAYVSRVEAYSKTSDIELQRVRNSLEVEGYRLKEHLAKLESIVQNVQAQSAVASGQLDAFRTEAIAYETQLKGETARLEGETRVYDLEIQQARYAAEIELKNAEINIENAKNSLSLVLEALKSGASVGSSLAAASLSAMNIGANISGSSQDVHSYQEK